ncbi:MAG TPA: hypothetical protein VFA68_00650 [Terriglobales bacterium]|nr:hypothetical protein [Terriglobales bacterium]
MKNLFLALFCSVLILSAATCAQTWNLAKDLGQTSNQISFNQGSNQAWYFMESATLVHDPTLYRFMTQYLGPCQSSASGDMVNGVGCWHGTESTIGDVHLHTEIAFNFTNELLDAKDDEFAGYKPRAALLTATWERLAIIAWRSPITGVVRVDGEFGFRSFKAAGVNWYVDKGGTTVTWGHLFGGDCCGPVKIGRVPIRKGEVLYFIANDLNTDQGYTANPLDLRMEITQVR